MPSHTRETVSVIIPAFNALRTLSRAVESVRNQTVAVHEIIVVDDGSSDGTAELARSLGSDITFIQQSENRGPSEARNVGAQRASGDLLAFLDADDVWYSDKVEAQLAVFAANPDIVLSCTNFVRFPTEHPVPPPSTGVAHIFTQ